MDVLFNLGDSQETERGDGADRSLRILQSLGVENIREHSRIVGNAEEEEQISSRVFQLLLDS